MSSRTNRGVFISKGGKLDNIDGVSSQTVLNQTGAGNTSVVNFDDVVSDSGSNYYNSTGIFTAPWTMLYEVNAIVCCSNIGEDMTTGVFLIETPSGDYRYELNP